MSPNQFAGQCGGPPAVPGRLLPAMGAPGPAKADREAGVRLSTDSLAVLGFCCGDYLSPPKPRQDSAYDYHTKTLTTTSPLIKFPSHFTFKKLFGGSFVV